MLNDAKTRLSQSNKGYDMTKLALFPSPDNQHTKKAKSSFLFYILEI